MRIGDQRYKIYDLEFYVNDYENHCDTFATCFKITNENQKGQWLIRSRNKYNTIDIAIGAALNKGSTKPAGTIRLNSIYLLPSMIKSEIKTNQSENLVSSCKIVQKILKVAEVKKLDQLLNLANGKFSNDIFQTENICRIEDISEHPDLIQLFRDE